MKVDDSLLYSVPGDYKIHLLDQYEKLYLVKIVKYLDGELTNARSSTGTNESSQITHLQEENKQLTQQNKHLSNEVDRLGDMFSSQMNDMLRMKIQLEKGLTPNTKVKTDPKADASVPATSAA